MADKKISQLDLAAQINNDAVIPMSQENGGEQTTYKALITAVAAKIGEGTTFSNLNTNAKNLVGAINEIEAGGGGGGSSNANLAPDYDSTSTYAVGDWCIYNGTLYQCNTAIPTAEAFDPTHWTAKKVVDAFADIEDELDDKVNTTDFLATNLPISSINPTNTKDYIDAVSGDIPTLHRAESSGAVGVNGTWQIPTAVLNHALVIVSIRRQGLGNSAIFTKDDLFARDNGFMLASSPTQYGILKCDNNGLLTVLTLSNMNDVFIRAIGIF